MELIAVVGIILAVDQLLFRYWLSRSAWFPIGLTMTGAIGGAYLGIRWRHENTLKSTLTSAAWLTAFIVALNSFAMIAVTEGLPHSIENWVSLLIALVELALLGIVGAILIVAPVTFLVTWSRK
jgi:hypothetical protein